MVGAVGAFSSPPFELFGVCPDCRNGHAYPKANPAHTSCAINPHHHPIRYRGPVLFDYFADAKNYGHRIHLLRCQTFTHGGDEFKWEIPNKYEGAALGLHEKT
jgi:hypothetical protein